MGIDSPQKKPGTQFIPSPGSEDRGDRFDDPLKGEGDAQTSTHTDFRKGSPKGDKGGSPNQEGQERRGFVFNDSRNAQPTDDATVAPDGTNRVKKIG